MKPSFVLVEHSSAAVVVQSGIGQTNTEQYFHTISVKILSDNSTIDKSYFLKISEIFLVF